MGNKCRKCGIPFEVTDDDLKFYDSVSPVIGGKKYSLPSPTLCPNCRQQRRLSHCNEQFLYSGKCGLCGKATLTQYPPSSNKPYYCRECWHSDKWDASSYGKDIDFSRSIFDQIHELRMKVPSLGLNSQGTCINSDYIHYAGTCKNCYLIMHADFCEDCYYGYGFKNNVFCVDGFYNLHCQFCYECVDCHKCYGLKFCQDCVNCHSSSFLRDCVGCKNCFMCAGLREKEYCFENKQLAKQEYESKIKEFDLGSYKACRELMERRIKLEKNHTFKEYQGHNLQNCQGNYLMNCKDAKFCFDCEDVDNAKYCFQIVLGGKNIYDIYQFGTNLQQSYECTICGEEAYHVLFCDNSQMSSSDLYYCWYMEACKNCFACVDMIRKNYCILNKQYSKEEYEKLVPKIIEHMKNMGEWGEFFPSNDSFFGYNKSTTQLYYPLERAAAAEQGFKWDEYDPPLPKVEKVLSGAEIPDNIKDVSEDITKCAVECEVTKKLFKITPQEFAFYKKHTLPLPRRSPNQRHLDRHLLRNPRAFYQRNCGKCDKEILTTFPPEKYKNVYCERCYLETVY